jgi:lipopolysaccharide/colanic/teichoic acid biosynthesis glycosyltransferase
MKRYQDLPKRIFDIITAFIGLLLLLPIFGLIAWRIKRDSPGPVFYRGSRLGRDGNTFHILKFRTMYEHPDSYNGPIVTSGDDQRITQVGKWLRNSKLNELPQLWNVLKGEMSLVGPRPEDPEIVAGWSEEARAEILSVRPGITSPASILYRDEETLLNGRPVMDIYLDEIQPSKIRLDQLYVRHRSFWGDLDIIFWTLLVLIPQTRTTKPPEGSLFWGPIARFMRRDASWFIIDTLITFAAIGLVGLIWRSFTPFHLGWIAAILLAVCFSILFSTTNMLLGVNRIRWSQAPAMDVLDLLPGVALATTVAMLASYYFPASLLRIIYQGNIPDRFTVPIFPPAMIIVASALALFGFILIRYRSRLVTGLATRWVRWRGVGSTQERVLIIGGGETGQFAALLVNGSSLTNSLRVIGFIDDDLYKQDFRIRGVNVLGGRSEIPKIVNRKDIGIIIFAIHNISAAEREQLLEICNRTPAQVMLFPNIPAAMNKLARHEYDGSPTDSGLSDDDTYSQLLPSTLFTNKASPAAIDGWLDQLETLAKDGHIEELLANIQELRRHLQADEVLELVHDPSLYPSRDEENIA